MEPHRQNGDPDERPVEDEEGDVGIAEHLSRRVKSPDPVGPRHVVIDAYTLADEDAHERRVGVVGEMRPVVGVTARVTRRSRRNGT
jgi:hypothetical protein